MRTRCVCALGVGSCQPAQPFLLQHAGMQAWCGVLCACRPACRHVTCSGSIIPVSKPLTGRQRPPTVGNVGHWPRNCFGTLPFGGDRSRAWCAEQLDCIGAATGSTVATKHVSTASTNSPRAPACVLVALLSLQSAALKFLQDQARTEVRPASAVRTPAAAAAVAGARRNACLPAA